MKKILQINWKEKVRMLYKECNINSSCVSISVKKMETKKVSMEKFMIAKKMENCCSRRIVFFNSARSAMSNSLYYEYWRESNSLRITTCQYSIRHNISLFTLYYNRENHMTPKWIKVLNSLAFILPGSHSVSFHSLFNKNV